MESSSESDSQSDSNSDSEEETLVKKAVAAGFAAAIARIADDMAIFDLVPVEPEAAGVAAAITGIADTMVNFELVPVEPEDDMVIIEPVPVVTQIGEPDENGLVCDADGSCYYYRPAEPELPVLVE